MFPSSLSSRARSLPRSPRYVVLTALFAFAAACGGSGGSDAPTNPGTPGNTGTPSTPAPVATTSVSLQNNAFSPTDIQVSPGATVTFTNLDGYNHTVTFDNTTIASVDQYATGAKTVTMPTAPGTYAYHCQIHGAMKGTVLVK